jgi:cyclic pyranopterin phosphate synthase
MTPYDVADEIRTAPPGRPVQRVASAPLLDPFARRVDYVRVSVTDRCDLRCAYSMPERMQFLPRAEVLTLEELDRVCSVFVGLGMRKLRLTGGEPLVRKGFVDLVQGLSRHLKTGVRRINVSLDTLDAEKFRRLTHGGRLEQVMAGLDAAVAAGLKVKINTVALKHDNLAEIPALAAWAHGRGFDLTLIETMPLGVVDEDRTDQFVSLDQVRDALAAIWTLSPEAYATGGPARYVRLAETGGRVGFITPLSHNFCESCNRVRVTCTGVLHTCLGQDDAMDLRAPLRAHPDDDGPLEAAIRAAIGHKPKGHDFHIGRNEPPAVARHMSTTGG